MGRKGYSCVIVSVELIGVGNVSLRFVLVLFLCFVEVFCLFCGFACLGLVFLYLKL